MSELIKTVRQGIGDYMIAILIFTILLGIFAALWCIIVKVTENYRIKARVKVPKLPHERPRQK